MPQKNIKDNYDYIVNPETNRKVSIKSRKGKQIINQYKNLVSNMIGG